MSSLLVVHVWRTVSNGTGHLQPENAFAVLSSRCVISIFMCSAPSPPPPPSSSHHQRHTRLLSGPKVSQVYTR